MSNQNQFQHKLGKGMITIAWLLLLGLLTLLFSNMLEQQEFPNQDLTHGSGNQTVTLQMNRSGHYLAPGRINGTPVKFLLDTGATDVAIPDKLARQLQLDRGIASMSQTANGLVKSYSTILDSVRLGNIELNQIRASIIPGMPGGEVLLGMSFLKHLDMVQKGKQLTLSK